MLRSTSVHRRSRVDRQALIAWYRRNRTRTSALFDVLATEEAYYSQPISLRHPLVFYEGHLPAFSFNTLIKKAFGGPGIDDKLERLFARGIDPDHAPAGPSDPDRNRRLWPSRDSVQAFAAAVDERVLNTLEHADLDRPGHPMLDRAEALVAILEHEAMHHETILYLWHRLPVDQKMMPAGYAPHVVGRVPAQEWIEVPAGVATLGVDRQSVAFAWDNECGPHTEEVRAFAIGKHNVTNEAFLAFVADGGYETPAYWDDSAWQWVHGEGIRHPQFWARVGGDWYWRGMFDLLPLPLSWPVYVSQAEAAAYARWQRARLPTEGEFSRAAFGAPGGERRHPWGDEAPGARHGVFDFSGWEPEPAGGHPAGCSAWGVEDLVGNGWEWTSTVFAPFPGFVARESYPEYSADFFDGQHVVLKGASPATAVELIRPTFRNWFRPRYPHVYATFRCARDLSA